LPDRSSIMLAEHFLAGGSTPSQKAVRREDADRVDQALADLDEGSREVLLMRHLEGLSHAEIGLPARGGRGGGAQALRPRPFAPTQAAARG